jgi:hypothetical protein
MAGLARFLLAVDMAVWLASPAIAQRAADPGTAAADIIRGRDLQTELPRDLDEKAGDVVRRLDLLPRLGGPTCRRETDDE